jgi:hypothetical protein
LSKWITDKKFLGVYWTCNCKGFACFKFKLTVIYWFMCCMCESICACVCTMLCVIKLLQFVIAVTLCKCSHVFQKHLKPRRIFRWFVYYQSTVFISCSYLRVFGVLWTETPGTKAPSFLMVGKNLW